jgi:hypothetical protein
MEFHFKKSIYEEYSSIYSLVVTIIIPLNLKKTSFIYMYLLSRL